MPRDCLMIFLKAPRPGYAKTRLAKDPGPDLAANAYRQMLDTLLQHLRSIKPVQLFFDPPDARSEIIPWLQPSWRAHPQSSGDLSQRLSHAFQSAFATGFSRVAVIGSDTPHITPADIQLAWDSLADHDVVLGPATDGGYWLISLKQWFPSLFENIPWSSPAVLSTTLDRARASALKVFLLRELSDIDTAADWRRFLDSSSPP